MAHGPIPEIVNALRDTFEGIAQGIVGLKPKDWRVEIASWLVLYVLISFVLHLPPFFT